MNWKDIIKEDFKDEMFFISENGQSFIDGVFDSADLRFGIDQSTFGKIKDAVKKHKGKAFNSMTIKRTEHGVVVDFNLTEFDKEMDYAFDLLLLNEIYPLLRKSKYIRQVNT